MLAHAANPLATAGVVSALRVEKWKHAFARQIVHDVIDVAVDFSDCRHRILGDDKDVRLGLDSKFVCNDNCLEFTIKGNFHERPLLLDACTCCQLTTTRDVRTLLMRLARKWNIKHIHFLSMHFTTMEGGLKKELRGNLMEDMLQRGVIEFHFSVQ